MFDYSGKGDSPTIPYNNVLHFTIRWTPRVIIPGLAGYYSLGLAYERGLMAAIDQLAIRILRSSMGYIGIGAFMPTFQWYSAWGVRMCAVIITSILYDLVERIIRLIYANFNFQPPCQDLSHPI